MSETSHPGHEINYQSFFTRLKHGIGADFIFFSCYIYATEKLCHKGTLYI